MNTTAVVPTAAETVALNPRKARIYRAAMQVFSEHGDPELNVSELAAIAGVARGTIYNNIGDLRTLFTDVSAHVIAEMGVRLGLALSGVTAPERRLAMSMRAFIRRSHEEPYWGKFMMRYALSTPSFEALLIGLPLNDVVLGLEAERYTFRSEQLPSVLAMVGGTVLSAMRMVQEGHKTWRDAGTDAAEFVLRAMGVPAAEAQNISAADLPPLPVLE